MPRRVMVSPAGLKPPTGAGISSVFCSIKKMGVQGTKIKISKTSNIY